MNILITGGSSGLGKAIIELLATKQEHNIFFTYNSNSSSAKAILKACSGTTAIKCDFTKPEEVDQLVEKIASLELDVIINNAYVGLALGRHFIKTSPDDFMQSFTDNVLPVIAITQAALKEFKKRKFGKIINVLTSYLINLPPNGCSVYAANKAYIQQLSKSWNTEFSRFNITSNCISPDFMLTNLSKEVDERVIEQLQGAHPLKSILTPLEVAQTVVYLVGASQQINGVNIPINAAQNILK